MTDQPTPADNGNSDADRAQAPVEQPYYVPTEHQQAWSAAQQYPFHPQPPLPYGSQPPLPYGSYVRDGAQPLAAGGGYGPPPAGPYGNYGDYPQPGFGPYPQHPYWAPPPVPTKSRPHKMLYGSVAAAVAVALAVGGIALAVDHANNGSSQQTALTSPNQNSPFSQNGGSQNGGSSQNGSGQNGFGLGGNGSSDGSGSGSSGSGSSGSGTGGSGSANQATGSATSAQQVGIVDINTTLDYGQGKAAGTGMVLTANGEILTNNHVVEDSTSLSVTVISTGKTYTATVVGTDPTDDVAVIQLKDASGLATAKLGDSSKIAVGAAVTAVGNAGGTGGTPTSAAGTIGALNQSITASDESGSNAEKLTGMFEVNADIQAGDSGGPLYENAGGTIVGMNTAASSAASSRYGASAATVGFAIPIAKATSIASQIESGVATSTIHLGYPAFLGVQLSASAQAQAGGATIGGVVSGSAAAKAGLAAGDTITSVDGKAIASATALSAATTSHHPGDQVKIGYTDSSGKSHSITVTLGQGPAD